MRLRPAGPLPVAPRASEPIPSDARNAGARATAPKPTSAPSARAIDAFIPAVAPAPTPSAPIVVRAEPNAPIPDKGSMSSTVTIPEGGALEDLTLDLQLAHSWKGDLRVTLTSPGGTSVVVHDRTGGSTDDVRGSFQLGEAFKGEKAEGIWTLKVEDLARSDTGKLESWGLSITAPRAEPTDPTVPTEPTDPEPQPPHADADPISHLQVLASPDLQGRGSPSDGYDAASAYVAEKLAAWGATPGNAANADQPFFQPFEIRTLSGGTLAADQSHDEPHSLRPEDFSAEQFENAFYVSPEMSADSLATINERYQEASWAQGQRPRSGTGPNGQLTADELRSISEAAGTVQNVVGRFEGSGPNKDKTIVLMAHLDHVGKNSRGQIFPGADDNASGSSVLLSLLPKIQELQAAGQLDRSIVVVWTAAEEEGLIGASYLKDHPLPGTTLAEIDGVINMDMVGRWDDERISVLDAYNGRTNYWSELVEQANAQMDNPFDRINRDLRPFQSRQDGAVFSRAGEDVLMVFEGLSNPKGGGDLIPEYHGTGDTIDRILSENGGEKMRRISELLGHLIPLASNRAS